MEEAIVQLPRGNEDMRSRGVPQVESERSFKVKQSLPTYTARGACFMPGNTTFTTPATNKRAERGDAVVMISQRRMTSLPMLMSHSHSTTHL